MAFAIGTSVVLRDRNRDEFVLFAVFCFNLGLFHLARFFADFSQVQLFAWSAQTISLVLPWSADRCFSAVIPSEGARPQRSTLRTVLLVLLLIAQATAFFVLVGSSPFDLQVDAVVWDWVSLGLNIYVVFGLFLVALRMWRAARSAEGTASAPRLRYLFYASLIALALGSPLIPAVGPIVTAVYLYFVAQTLQRERLLELPEVVARILTLSLLVVSATAVFALLLLWIPTQTSGSGVSLFLFNIAVASYAVIVLIDPVRAEFESRIESWLFRDRSALRALLVQLRFKLLNVIDPDEMVEVMIDALRDSNRVTRASVYLLDARGTSLMLAGALGDDPDARLDFATRRPLLDRLRLQGPMLRDVLQRDKERAPKEQVAELEEILEVLVDLGAGLAVPIVKEADGDGPELLGALFVDDERLLEPFSGEEVELFEGLAAQAAITLQNSAVYERRKERDRLAALGEMSAGLAHEIRNPLGAIKGAVQVVQPAMDRMDPTTREFLGVIVEEVERLNRVVVQFLSYSRPFKGEMGTVHMREVVQATVRLIEPTRLEQVHIDVPADLPPVRGDADALRQVLHNLVLNALDAVGEPRPGAEPAPKVWVEGRFRRRGLPDGDAVAVTVRDNGPGLTAQTMSNLFVPFHTTKSGGTGLGLPISQRIVENHRGVIEVGNTAEGGAAFTVLIPAEDLPDRAPTEGE